MAEYMPEDFRYKEYENGYAVIVDRDVKFVPRGGDVVGTLEKIRSECPEKIPKLIRLHSG